MYNISNTNNIGNICHLMKEQFTWQFGNMAGVTMYLQLPFNSSSHLFYLHDLCKSQTYMDSCADWGQEGDWFLHLVCSVNFLSWKKMSCKKVVLQGTTPPFILSSCYCYTCRSKEANLSHVVWIKICNC